MTRNSDELKQYYIDELGSEFGTMYFAVEDEWGKVLYLYQEYMELFGDSDKVTILNTLGSGIGYIQAFLGEALILGLCRLTDEDSRSASVWNLPDFICNNPDLKEKVQGYADEVAEYAKAARKRRNKWIAHSDIERKATKVTFGEIKSGLDFVYKVLHIISVEYLGTHSPNKIDSRKGSPMAKLVLQLSRLVEGVTFIDSFIDPTEESNPLDEKVNIAFLKKLGVDSISTEDEIEISRIRMAAKIIRESIRKNDI